MEVLVGEAPEEAEGDRMKNRDGREQIYGKAVREGKAHGQGGLDAKRTEAEAIARLTCSSP